MNQTKTHVAISAFVGAGYLVVALNAPNWVHGLLTVEIVPYTLFSAPLDTQLLFGAMYPGVFLLGAVATYAYLERGFVLPGVVVVIPYLVALWFEAQGNPDQADLISVVGIYLIGWFIVLGAALLAGSLEWGIRRVYATRAEVPGGQ